MLVSGNDFEKLLTRLLHPEGFRRKGRNWYLDRPEVVVFVNLQRSQWSELYYLNIGALVKSISNEPWEIRDRTRPRAGESHYNIRLENLFTEKPVPPAKITPQWAKIHALLELYNRAFDPEQREQELTAIIEERMIPFLRMCRTEKGLRTAIMDVLQSSGGTSGVLRDHLSISGIPGEAR